VRSGLPESQSGAPSPRVGNVRRTRSHCDPVAGSRYLCKVRQVRRALGAPCCCLSQACRSYPTISVRHLYEDPRLTFKDLCTHNIQDLTYTKVWTSRFCITNAHTLVKRKHPAVVVGSTPHLAQMSQWDEGDQEDPLNGFGPKAKHVPREVWGHTSRNSIGP
jgi:hypothetical protein